MLGKLIKIRLRSILSRTTARKKNGKGMLVLFAFLMLYCAGVFGFMFYHMFGFMAEFIVLDPQHHWFYFAMIGLMSFGLSFFFTAFTAKSELFEATDNELLLSMPIRPRTILLSRMAILLGLEYLISLLVMVPAGAAWFAAAGLDVTQLVLYIAGSVFLPLISASLACLLGWLLALLTARARNKTLVTMIFSLAFLAIYFFVYFNAQRYITSLMQHYQSVADGMMGWGFLFFWYGKGIADPDWLLFLLVAVLALAAFTAAFGLLGKGFLEVGSSENLKKRRTGELTLRSSKLSSALLRKEFKRFTSSAIYMLNSGLGLLLAVIAAVALFVKANAVRELLTLLRLQPELSLSDLDLALIASILTSLFCSMNVITAPSVSLEGKTLWILRSAPIPASAVLAAKLKLHVYLCALPTLLLSAAAGYVLRPDALGWIVLLLAPQMFVLLSGVFGLVMNLCFPKLDWTNEAVPVKQSASVLLTMLPMMAYTVFAGVGFAVLVFAMQLLTPTAFLLIVLGVALVWLLFSCLWLWKKGPKKFETL
ncbi:MAG: hypothetical protein IJG45_07930 [Oscillospiraceae bacterium]|nr:hypothetical protein [Oscillospiraceae bacterium]